MGGEMKSGSEAWIKMTVQNSTHHLLLSSSSQHAHLLRRIPEVKQLRPLHASLRRWPHHLNLLQMWRVREELHLNPCAVQDIPYANGRVRAPSAYGNQHAVEHGRRLVGNDGDDAADAQLSRRLPREQLLHHRLLLCREEVLVQVLHEAFAFLKSRGQGAGHGRGDQGGFGEGVGSRRGLRR